ncbi:MULTISPECIES: hypothetical protein [unclassified Bradyrhizobium]|uniref:hypothetical protein n=1 Tax=unclassified Bradyrhizobium TaxID=2631580 RepID=UPI00339909EE
MLFYALLAGSTVATGAALYYADKLNQRDNKKGIYHPPIAAGRSRPNGGQHVGSGKNGSAPQGVLQAKQSEGERIVMQARQHLKDAQDCLMRGAYKAALGYLEEALFWAKHQKFGLTPPKDHMFRIQIAVAIDNTRRMLNGRS